MKLQNLQKKYPRFIYESYFYKITKNNLVISFNFFIEPDIRFKPTITIKNVSPQLLKRVKDKVLNSLIFNLGLMEIPSYWKATCSPEIIIKAGLLNREQIRWWKDLIMNGMGQFFYENKIDFKKPHFLKFNVTRKDFVTNVTRKGFVTLEGGVLVPVGGGKDSVVTLELLKRVKKNINCFSLNPTIAAQRIMKIAGYKPCTRASSVRGKKPIIVRRKIDEKLLELNRRGFLNGHTPFSAYLAFLSVLVATIFGQRYIAFSNERSSNEGNVKYLGKVINHQWSKSFEFEQKFREYSQKYLTSGAEYFSFLRPLYEIQIAKLFSKYPKYFPAFLSCNEAYKTASGTKKPTKKWCGNCPKCLFIFATLYPFTNEKQLLKIFGKNLFENPEGKPSASYGAGKNLLPIMKQLIEERGFKPFECVGTKKESQIAFSLSFKKCREHFSANKKMPFLLEYFKKKILPKYPNLEKESKKILNSWNNQNNLPKEFERVLKKVIS